MPYRNAPYYVLACIAVIVAGFWESYFAPFLTVPWQFHAHGIAGIKRRQEAQVFKNIRELIIPKFSIDRTHLQRRIFEL